jgi:hypothetical protein
MTPWIHLVEVWVFVWGVFLCEVHWFHMVQEGVVVVTSLCETLYYVLSMVLWTFTYVQLWNLSVWSTMLELFCVKARSVTLVLCHENRMTQRESWLVVKVMQPLKMCQTIITVVLTVMSGMDPRIVSGYCLRWLLVNIQVCVTTSFLVRCEPVSFVGSFINWSC